MNFLIVDNGTSYLDSLEKLVKSTFRIISYSDIDKINPDEFDATILSGGHNFPVQGNEHELQQEIDFVQQFTKPILGICFGFEIIATSLGAKLECMPKREHGLLSIQVTEPDQLFGNTTSLQVFESHRWVVKEPSRDMLVLARSKDGIEAFKHQTKNIYAVQFHPEMFTEQDQGREIFKNFLAITRT